MLSHLPVGAWFCSVTRVGKHHGFLNTKGLLMSVGP